MIKVKVVNNGSDIIRNIIEAGINCMNCRNEECELNGTDSEDLCRYFLSSRDFEIKFKS